MRFSLFNVEFYGFPFVEQTVYKAIFGFKHFCWNFRKLCKYIWIRKECIQNQTIKYCDQNRLTTNYKIQYNENRKISRISQFIHVIFSLFFIQNWILYDISSCILFLNNFIHWIWTIDMRLYKYGYKLSENKRRKALNIRYHSIAAAIQWRTQDYMWFAWPIFLQIGNAKFYNPITYNRINRMISVQSSIQLNYITWTEQK